jgi:hypothetical protein
MSRQWRFLSLGVVMTDETARGFLAAAERADDVAVETDGRRALLWVWRGKREGLGSRRLGSAWLRYGTPRPGEATIDQVAWDPQVGTEALLWDRLERLAGGRLTAQRAPTPSPLPLGVGTATFRSEGDEGVTRPARTVGPAA